MTADEIRAKLTDEKLVGVMMKALTLSVTPPPGMDNLSWRWDFSRGELREGIVAALTEGPTAETSGLSRG